MFNSHIILHQYTMLAPAIALATAGQPTNTNVHASKVSIVRVCWFTYDNLSNGIKYRSCHGGLGVGGDKYVHSICIAFPFNRFIDGTP